MCNRLVQNDVIVKPGQRAKVLMRGPGGEFEIPFGEAIFGGPAKRESRNYWIKREGAEDVLVPNVSRFGEKNKTTGEQSWEDVPTDSALEGLLLPQPPGNTYRLLKIVTQPATPEQLARLGNDRAPVVHPPPVAPALKSPISNLQSAAPDPTPGTHFLCPECGSRQFSEGCFVETVSIPGDPWSYVLQRYTCAQCGYVIPGHLGELWNGMTPEAAAQEWKQIFRSTADRRRV